MNGHELLDKMELVDPAFVEAADAASAKKRTDWVKWGALAACFCVVILGGLAVRSSEKKPALPENPQYIEASMQEDGTPAVIPNNGIYEEEAPERDDSPILSMLAPDPDEPQIEACYAAPQNGTVQYSVPLSNALAAYGSSVRYRVVAFLFRNEIQLKSDGPEVMREMERLNEAGYPVFYETVDESGTSFAHFSMLLQESQLADFAASGEYGYMMFFYGEVFKDDSASASEVFQSSVETEVQPEYLPIPMRLQEARKDETFGAYLPRELPEGLDEEEILRYTEPGNESLFAIWCNNSAEVDWKISSFKEADRTRLTGVDETENYDLSLYPIPRADSVPQELYEIVNDPIFEADDLTRDAVMARAYRRSERGDSGSWYMAFSVKYGDILVTVHAKGVEPEWVWQQLQALAD